MNAQGAVRTPRLSHSRLAALVCALQGANAAADQYNLRQAIC